jgi:hypothetical protein
MKRRIVAVGTLLLAAFGVGLTGCRTAEVRHDDVAFSGHDSPIDVGGGSIYGKVGFWNLNRWSEVHPSRLYGSRSTNSDYIQLTGFTDPQNSANSPTLFENTGGWLITISSRNSDKSPHPKSIAFCTSVTPTLPHHCTGDSLESDSVVYLEVTSSTATWDLKNNGWKEKLMFDDSQPGCTGTESVCDQIDSILITTVKPITSIQPSSQSSGLYTYGPYICTENKKCHITAGK